MARRSTRLARSGENDSPLTNFDLDVYDIQAQAREERKGGGGEKEATNRLPGAYICS
jgi:hypothetical protein